LLVDMFVGVVEMQPERPYSGEYAQALKLWLESRSIPQMVNNLIDEVNGLTSQVLSEFLSDFAMYRLPWGTSAFLAIAKQTLGLSDDDLPLAVRSLPALLKYGVPSPIAAWLMGLGISSRAAAVALSSRYQNEEGTPDPGAIRRWLGEQDPELLGFSLGFIGERLANLGRVCQRNRRFTIDFGTSIGDVLPISAEVPLMSGDATEGALASFAEGHQVRIERDYRSGLDRNRMVAMIGEVIVAVLPPRVSQVLAIDVDAGASIDCEAQLLEDPKRLVLELTEGPLSSY
jgi:hypothetical protein